VLVGTWCVVEERGVAGVVGELEVAGSVSAADEPELLEPDRGFGSDEGAAPVAAPRPAFRS
jgi:hypothetical protein